MSKIEMERRWIDGTGGYGWKSILPCEKAERKKYRFGDFNPSVSVKNYSGRGGHETWGEQQ